MRDDTMSQRRIVQSFLLAAVCAGCGLMEGPRTGEIRISINTIGAIADRDPNGYTLRDEEGKTYSLPANGFLRIPEVPTGSNVYTLEGIEPNCTVAGGNVITVDVDGDLPTNVGISVTCSARTGTLVITTVTTGSSKDSDGYFVAVGNLAGNSIASNGTTTLSGVPAGNQTVRLTGVAQNCAVVGAHPRSVSIPFLASVNLDFTIDCAPAGSVRIVTATTGDATDTDGYTIELRLDGFPSTTRYASTSSGEATFSGIPTGSYLLSMYGLLANCDVSVPSPRNIVVTEGVLSRVDVDVVCAAPEALAIVTESSSTGFDISTIRSDGTGFAQLTSDARSDLEPAWSPDKNRIAFASDREGSFEIYSMDSDGANLVRLTNNLATDRNPAWSPDGTRIAFESDRSGNVEVYVMNADGTNQVRLTENNAADIGPAWSPDGTRIAFASDRAGLLSIFAMKSDGSEVTRLSYAALADRRPAWSPDGTRIAFSGAVSPASNAIYVLNSDGSERTGITNALDNLSGPAWSPAGDKIAFTSQSCDYYYYYDYCSLWLRFVDVRGREYWSAITNRSVRDVAWR